MKAPKFAYIRRLYEHQQSFHTILLQSILCSGYIGFGYDDYVTVLALNHLLRYFLLFSTVHLSNSSCTSGICERMSFLRNVDNKQNSFLHGYVIETMSLTTLDECFHMCLRKCQCLSFNFNDLNKTQDCELNDATFKMYPEALKERKAQLITNLPRNIWTKMWVNFSFFIMIMRTNGNQIFFVVDKFFTALHPQKSWFCT